MRVVQRSSVQFVLNALFGIGIGALFAWRAASTDTPTTVWIPRARPRCAGTTSSQLMMAAAIPPTRPMTTRAGCSPGPRANPLSQRWGSKCQTAVHRHVVSSVAWIIVVVSLRAESPAKHSTACRIRQVATAYITEGVSPGPGPTAT